MLTAIRNKGRMLTQNFQDNLLLGLALNFLVNMIEKMSAEPGVANTFGPADMLRNETSLASAVHGIVKVFKEALANERFKVLLMKTLLMSCVTQHVAYQLREWS